jgi:branched-chain amino acid transport system substrate-binding protein
VAKATKLKVVYYDDESTPSRASQLTERLVKQDGVEFMLGPYSTTMTKAVAPVTEKYKVPMVEAEGASRSLFTQGYKYMFAVLSTSEYYLAPVLDLIAQRTKAGIRPLLICVSVWHLKMTASHLMFVPVFLMLQKNTT